MEIVDAQVHLNRLYAEAHLADPDQVFQAAITAMDAVGISTVLIIESVQTLQGDLLPNGAVRGNFQFSKRAIAQFPDRFGYGVLIDPEDPELEQQVSEIRPQGGLGMRVIPRDADYQERFADGRFEPLFAAAERHGVPVFILLPKRLDLLEPYLRKFPKLWVILDHCGVGHPPPPDGQAYGAQMAQIVTPTLAERIAELDQVIELACYPNLAVKWSFAPAKLSAEPYPYRDATQLLLRVVEAFGVERVMWASDYTASRAYQTWAQSLHHLLYTDQLSETQKEWLFGRSVRHVLNWSKG